MCTFEMFQARRHPFHRPPILSIKYVSAERGMQLLTVGTHCEPGEHGWLQRAAPPGKGRLRPLEPNGTRPLPFKPFLTATC